MANPRIKTKKEASHTFGALAMELPIYALLVAGYFFLVLHYLGEWLGHLHKNHTLLYALVSIGLIIVQAVVLESVSTGLLRLLRGRGE